MSFQKPIDNRPSGGEGQFSVESIYNEIADVYNKIRKRDSADRLLDLIIANVDPGSTVLDVGCGTGYPITARLSETYETYGIDISEKMLEYASENISNSVTLSQIDVREANFNDNSFQAIVMYYSLVDIPRRDHRYILNKIYNWLDDGGYLLFSTGRGDYNLKTTNNWLGLSYTKHWSFYENKKYLDMLEDIGYKNNPDVLEASHKLEGDTKRMHPFILAQK